MSAFWKSDTPAQQKWLIVIFLLVILGALVPMFSRSFVPSAAWQLQALYLSVLLTVAGSLWLWRLYRQQLWRPAGPWLSYGPVKRALMTPLCLAFFIGMLWLDIAGTLPMLYTTAFGVEHTEAASAEKKRGSGRRSCSYQLKVPSINYLFFEFCIDEEDFNRLPEGPLPAQLSAQQSYFGARIHTIELSVPRQRQR